MRRLTDGGGKDDIDPVLGTVTIEWSRMPDDVTSITRTEESIVSRNIKFLSAINREKFSKTILGTSNDSITVIVDGMTLVNCMLISWSV